MNITTLGIDLAKTSFSIIGMDKNGKIVPFRITKQGDSYLRACLVHGARALLANLRDKQDKVSCWARELVEQRGHLRAIVAMAARKARLIWTLMTKQEEYKILFTNKA